MDEDNDNTSEVNSIRFNKAPSTKIFDLTKKRKLRAEQLGLPVSKHKCGDHRLPSEPLSTLEENLEVEELITQVIKENAEQQAFDDGSEPESAKDSNSFVGDSDSIMSVYGDAKSDSEVSTMFPCDRPSPSSSNWGFNGSRNPQCSSDNEMAIEGAGKEKLNFAVGERNPCHNYDELQGLQNLEEPIQEFGSHFDYICSQYENDGVKLYTDKELDDILYSNGVNPNIYILSSGRWSVNQDAQSGARKPTIDQEFEQYFSMLML